MADFDLNDLTSVEPAEFARLVKSTPDAKLAEVMAGTSARRSSPRSSAGSRACSGPIGPATPAR